MIVEMTGIFEVICLESVKPLRSMLQDNFLWLDNDKPKKLVSNYHVDNEAAKKADPQRRRAYY